MSLRPRALVPCLVLLALLAAPAAASIAKPASGAHFDLLVGQSVNVKLSNAGGCKFSYLAETDHPEFVELTGVEGIEVTKGTVSMFGTSPGSGVLTITSMDFSCPPAVHTYTYEVLPDFAGALKDFTAGTNDAGKQVKLDIKAAFKNYSNDLLSLSAEYKAGNLDDDGLQDGFHDASTTLRRDAYAAGEMGYAAVLGLGTQLLLDNAATYETAPLGFFAGGCGPFDKFQDGVCSQFAKFHDTFDKASKKGIKSFEKAGAPVFGQWATLPPLFAGGPFLPEQAGAITLPQTLTGPFNFTIRPATDAKAENGRLLVSGRAATALSGSFEVSLTWEEIGELTVITTHTPTIVDDEWTDTFEGLRAGAYTLTTRYADDDHSVGLVISIPFDPLDD